MKSVPLLITATAVFMALISPFIYPESTDAKKDMPESVLGAQAFPEKSSTAEKLLKGEKVKMSKAEVEDMVFSAKEEISKEFVLTVVRDDLTASDVEKIARLNGSTIPSHHKAKQPKVGNGKYVAMAIPEDTDVENFLYELNNNESVLLAEPAYKRNLFWVPNDTNFSTQWQLQTRSSANYGIQMTKAWDEMTSRLGSSYRGGKSSVIVAVLDTGLAMNNRTVSKCGVGEETYEDGWVFTPNSEIPINIWVNPDETSGDQDDDDGNGYIDDENGVNIDDYYNYEIVYTTGNGYPSCDGHTEEDGYPDDDYGHGTHVSNTIAAATNNSGYGAGIAYNTTIMPIKIFDYTGSIWSYSVVDALSYAIDNGADVINMSFGGSDSSSVEEAIINQAVSGKMIPVAASGNYGNSTRQYPAAYTNVIAVGASNKDGSRSSYSTYGNWIDLVAPVGDTGNGSGVYQYNYTCYHEASQSNPLPCTMDNTAPLWDPEVDSFVNAPPVNPTFAPSQGTSFAAPEVAGVSALLKSINPNYTLNQVRYKLQWGAYPSGSGWYNNEKGYGILDAYATLIAPDLPATTYVYRFWSDAYNGHFYTSSVSERDYIIATWPNVWDYEGKVYKVPSLCSNGASSVYRFWSNRFRGHFYTISVEERDQVIALYDDNTWLYEGKAFCGYNSERPGTKPLYRFWSSRFGHHFYTASVSERDYVIDAYSDWTWAYEGVGFYVSDY